MYYTRFQNWIWNKKFLTVFLFLFLFSTPFALAANLSLVSSSGNVNVGDNIQVRIVLSSSDKPANAVSGTINFPSNLLTLNSISKSNSIVNVWPVEPSYSNATGTVNFDGVILSGYQGSSGTILTLFFRAKAKGSVNVTFNNTSVLAHDGAGTPILNLARESSFQITELPAKVPTPTPTPTTEAPSTVTPSKPTLEIEELKKKDPLDAHSRFFITSTLMKPNTSYSIQIDNTPYVWEDSGNHIFETVPLSRGLHSMKVSFESVDGDIISENISFNTSSILAPVFTDYSNNVKENDFIVIKGIVDPLNYVVINSDALISNGGASFHESVTIRANEEGLFTYVSENRASRGVYMIRAMARTAKGLESAETPAIKISVQADSSSLINKLTNTFSIMIPAIAVFALLIIVIIYGWHRILHYRERMRKRLLETRALVSKSFSILEEDAEEEAKILKKEKGKSLTKEEREFVNQFKKDLDSAERTILDDLKSSDKDI